MSLKQHVAVFVIVAIALLFPSLHLNYTIEPKGTVSGFIKGYSVLTFAFWVLLELLIWAVNTLLNKK